MSGDIPWAQVAYLALLLVAIGGFLLVELRARPGKTLRQAAAWVLIFVGAIAVAGLWPQLRDAISPRPVVTGERTMQIPIARDGHAHLTAQVNGEDVSFVVDTGASLIALSRRDARRVGIDPDSLAYYGQAQTANGIVATAPVRLAEVTIGAFTVERVEAVVIDGDIGTSLLGMTFLRRFARVSFERDRLLLEW